MAVIWTPELKAKAAATRLATKQKKEAAQLKREAKSSKIGQVDEHEEQETANASNGRGMGEIPVEVLQGGSFDWETCPLTEAINKAAEMKREYDRVAAIVLKRQNPNGRRWTCWTEENRLAKTSIQIPKSVMAQCARTGEDGKWKFRDDGRFVIVNGVRTLKPAFCCNAFCYQLYQAARAAQPR
jgi:hypothetical protein